MSIDMGIRPSELLSWTDEEEWDARLMFDMDIMSAYKTAESQANKKAMKRR